MIKNTKIPHLILLVFFLMTLVVGVTYAWLKGEKIKNININLGDVEQAIVVKYNNTTASLDSNNLYVANATLNNTDSNSIRNLNAIVVIKPKVDCYFRVKIEDEWVLKTRYKISGNENFKVVGHDNGINVFSINENDWYYDNIDGYFYYKKVLKKNTTNEINFISSGEYYQTRETTIIEETCNVNISFVLDSVQSNRYLEIWNTDRFLEGSGE